MQFDLMKSCKPESFISRGKNEPRRVFEAGKVNVRGTAMLLGLLVLLAPALAPRSSFETEGDDVATVGAVSAAPRYSGESGGDGGCCCCWSSFSLFSASSSSSSNGIKRRSMGTCVSGETLRTRNWHCVSLPHRTPVLQHHLRMDTENLTPLAKLTCESHVKLESTGDTYLENMTSYVQLHAGKKMRKSHSVAVHASE